MGERAGIHFPALFLLHAFQKHLLCGPMNTPTYHLKLPASVIASFERIAKEHCNINTLQTQFNDSLDFHDVHVAGLLRMLNDAYKLNRGLPYRSSAPRKDE